MSTRAEVEARNDAWGQAQKHVAAIGGFMRAMATLSVQETAAGRRRRTRLRNIHQGLSEKWLSRVRLTRRGVWGRP